METMQKITLPMNEATRLSLHAGDRLLLSGVIYTGRDAAHQRLVDAL
ncbi:MAG TPA: TRZ/ATZ family protein, partial [Acholeplasmatales bacterium]|nr:TRZ/ATZ family protein [Acholeplasmatales bacterium]